MLKSVAIPPAKRLGAERHLDPSLHIIGRFFFHQRKVELTLLRPMVTVSWSTSVERPAKFSLEVLDIVIAPLTAQPSGAVNWE
jgi:hypothetical protein